MTRPLLCLCLTAPTLAENLVQVRRFRRLVDLVELRVDLLHPSQWSGVTRFPLECPLPALCTIRRARDGGSWPAPEAARRRLLQVAAAARYRYLDLESDLPTRAVLVPPGGPRVIRSLHDIHGTPWDLDALLRGLARGAREIPKLAVMPRGAADLARIVAAARALRTPRIVLGMGDYGVPSRLLAARLGSWLTYTSAGRSAAPGHLDPLTMQRRYRFHSLRADTPVFGLIGNPVAHSRSPEVHNRGLAAAGVEGVYVPFRVDAVAEFLALAPALGVRGLSATIPHKETVMPLLTRTDPSVRGAGACNTLVREQGGWAGYNTDVAGFLAPLQAELAAGRIRRATVVGAGGAARAIVWALRGAGVEVLIANRSLPRARRLAAEMGAAAVALTAADLVPRVGGHSDLMVQATSVGMHAGAGEPAAGGGDDPLAAVPLAGHEIVYDIVYTPPNTPLVRRARAAGCQVICGGEMLLGQAYEQFRLFTGIDYPGAERDRMSAAFAAE